MCPSRAGTGASSAVIFTIFGFGPWRVLHSVVRAVAQPG